MKSYNVKEVIEFVKDMEYLRKIDKKEFEKIMNEIRILSELKVLKNELIENILRCDNLKNLKFLNNMLKIAINKETKSPMKQVQEIEIKIYKNMIDNDVI